MLAKLVASLIAIGACTLLVHRTPGDSLQAKGADPLVDSDDDFLPDCVEWVQLTSAGNPDTDGDQIADFVEFVQRGFPRQVGGPLPADQEMRLVVTGPVPGGDNDLTWLHLFVRLAEPSAVISGFQAWVELPSLPGLRLEFDLLGFGQPDLEYRDAGADGLWIRLSIPMVSSSLLQSLLPCSVQVESVLGNRYLRSGVKLFDLGGSITSLVPFDDNSFAAQSIAPSAAVPGISNRVCLLDLTEVGSGPAGTVFQIAHAFCDDCNEVECAPTCPASVGWLITVPGGLGVIGGH